MAGHEVVDYEKGIYRKESHAKQYIKIYVVLLILMGISLIGPEFGIKPVTLLTAFGIAFVKAYLVCAYFMHIKFETKWVGYMLLTCCVFMGLFFAGVAADVMKHEGSGWQNAAAATEVTRAMEEVELEGLSHTEILGAPTVELSEHPLGKKQYGSLLMRFPKKQPKNPASLNSMSKIDTDNYTIPIAQAMEQARLEKGKARKVIDPNAGAMPTADDIAKAEAEQKTLASQPNPAFTVDPVKAKAGEVLFNTPTVLCKSCHSNDGSKVVGPTFKGFWGRATIVEVTTEDPTSKRKKTTLQVVKADRNYYIESMDAPDLKKSRGYPGAMPAGQLPEAADREALLHYIVSLGAAEVVPVAPAEGQEGVPTDGTAPADGAAPAPGTATPPAAPAAAAPAAGGK